MKRFVSILIICVCGYASLGQEQLRTKHFNLEDGSLAIQGYDPVSYFKAGPEKGDKDIAHTYKGVTYRFANEANLNRFKKDPEKYEPVYGGWCAHAIGNSGEKVEVDPETYKIIDDKNYLFYNFYFTNTLKKWNAREVQLQESADSNWDRIFSK